MISNLVIGNFERMEEFKTELKGRIIKLLKLDDVSVEDIKDDDLLFGDGLELDSIDILELAILLDEKYGISIKNIERDKEVFSSINKIAEYISSRKKK